MKHINFETLDRIEKGFVHNKSFNCQTFTRTVYSVTIKDMNHATFYTFLKLKQFLSISRFTIRDCFRNKKIGGGVRYMTASENKDGINKQKVQYRKKEKSVRANKKTVGSQHSI